MVSSFIFSCFYRRNTDDNNIFNGERLKLEGQTPSEEVEDLLNMIKTKNNVCLNDCGKIRLLIGSKIAQARDVMRLNQLAFAKKADIKQSSSLSRIESGKVNITLDTLCRIANALNKPISYFFQEEQNNDVYKTLNSLQNQIAEIKEKYGK